MYSLGDVLNPQSPQAQAIVSLFRYFLILAAVIFLVVTGIVGYSIVRYRARAGEAEPRQDFGSRRLEITWTAIPLLIVLGLFIFTVRTMALVDAPLDPHRPPDLVVTGHQWWWDVRYSNGAAVATEIHIPAGRRLLARIESADVIHDFWAPQLARKIDAVPGRPGYIWLEADAPGIYRGACAEFCGMQHAWMRFVIVAQPESDFTAWLARQVEPEVEPPAGAAADGARLYGEKKCAECHQKGGPPLAHLAARRYLGGDLPNTPENLARWIAHPQTIKPGNHMADPQLSAAELQALMAYLGALR